MARGIVFPVWFSVSFTAMWAAMVFLSPASSMVATLVQTPISHTAQGFLPREMKDNRENTPQRPMVRPSSCFTANREPSCAEIAWSKRQVPTGSDPLHHNRSPFGRFLP